MNLHHKKTSYFQLAPAPLCFDIFVLHFHLSCLGKDDVALLVPSQRIHACLDVPQVSARSQRLGTYAHEFIKMALLLRRLGPALLDWSSSLISVKFAEISQKNGGGGGVYFLLEIASKYNFMQIYSLSVIITASLSTLSPDFYPCTVYRVHSIKTICHSIIYFISAFMITIIRCTLSLFCAKLWPDRHNMVMASVSKLMQTVFISNTSHLHICHLHKNEVFALFILCSYCKSEACEMCVISNSGRMEDRQAPVIKHH